MHNHPVSSGPSSPAKSPVFRFVKIVVLTVLGCVAGIGSIAILIEGITSGRPLLVVAGTIILLAMATWIILGVVKSRRQILADSASPRDAMLVCKFCGPFPQSKVVSRAPTRGQTWVFRATGTVLILFAVAGLRFGSGDVVEFLAICLGLCGVVAWHVSNQPANVCPTCGKQPVVQSNTPIGRQWTKDWESHNTAPVKTDRDSKPDS
jgi:hypothetical protein